MEMLKVKLPYRTVFSMSIVAKGLQATYQGDEVSFRGTRDPKAEVYWAQEPSSKKDQEALKT
jgi:hypothetical protein